MVKHTGLIPSEHAGKCRQSFLGPLSTGFKDDDGREVAGGQASLLQHLPSSPSPISTHLPILPSLLLSARGSSSHGATP